MNAGPGSFEFQGQWFRTKRELFMSKNARHGRFLRLLLQVMAGSRSVWPGMGCLWGAEPLNRRKTRTDLSTSLLPISYKYDDSEAGIPTIIVTLLPWTTQLSDKICCPALLLTKREKNSIWLKITGHEKSKVSVCLTAKADGMKLKPFIVFPGAKRETKQLNEEFKNKCYVASSVNGRMNEDLTRD